MEREKFEPEVEEYLNLKSKVTNQIYSSGLKKFLKFYQTKHGEDKGFGHFLDRIFEEFKKPPREQRRIAETEMSQFIDYLKNAKLSNNSVRLYFASVQNFLKYKQVTVSISFLGNMPAPTEKKTNGKHEWKIEQIKEFVEAAPSYRDKAIILCMFQSGLAVNEIAELNYGDIKEEFEKGMLPLCIRLVRQKTQVDFKTFIGRDAVKYIKLYLGTRGKLKSNDPLFTKERTRKGEARITTAAIQQSFGEIAKELSFVTVTEDTYNPARPHSLRAAFNSRLIGKIDETLRDFWMGHAIGGVSKAYLTMPTEDLRKLYMSAEEFLSIEKTSRQELEEKVRAEPSLADERIRSLEKQIADMYAFVHKNLDPLLDVIDEISNTPEGAELIKKLKAKKLEEEYEKSKTKD